MKFHIPEPCNENWNEMSPTEKGAFCQKCALEVTDFTNMSPFEIRDVLTEKYQKKERNCGHIKARQLNDVNDIGFYWKSEQQRFQSVWAVSLLAVFGLTLFSCQNTFTKEVVSQMEEEANTMLQDSTDSVDLEGLTKDLPKEDPNYGKLPVVTEFPFEEILYDGLISWEKTTGPILPEDCVFPTEKWEVVYMGDMVITTGSILAPSEEETAKLLHPFAPIQKPEVPAEEQVNPWPNRNNIGKRSDLVYDTETTDFIAYITRAPLTLESRLIIESFGNHEIYLLLENAENGFVHTDKSLEITEGVHSFTLGLDRLPVGNYQLELNSWRTVQNIHFQWNGVDSQST